MKKHILPVLLLIAIPFSFSGCATLTTQNVANQAERNVEFLGHVSVAALSLAAIPFVAANELLCAKHNSTTRNTANVPRTCPMITLKNPHEQKTK